MTTQLDQQNPAASGHGLVALAGEGRVYNAMGTSTTLKADGTDTGHACEVIESPATGSRPIGISAPTRRCTSSRVSSWFR